MTEKIVRTPTRLSGKITPEEKILLDAHTQMWIKRAYRTDPIDPAKIKRAIKGLYKVAGLKEPRVVIVSSPLQMAPAYGAAAAIWHSKSNSKTPPANHPQSTAYTGVLKAVEEATTPEVT